MRDKSLSMPATHLSVCCIFLVPSVITFHDWLPVPVLEAVQIPVPVKALPVSARCVNYRLWKYPVWVSLPRLALSDLLLECIDYILILKKNCRNIGIYTFRIKRKGLCRKKYGRMECKILVPVKQNQNVSKKIVSFQPDRKALQNYYRRNLEKEKNLFLALCCPKDAEIVLGKRTPSLEEFERISYLLDMLGLSEYGIFFQMKYGNLLDEIAKQVQTEIKTDSVNIDRECAKYEAWLETFLSKLPTSRVCHYIRQVFDV